MGKLEQRTAIITGGGRGIGKEIALTFAREGADIVIADVLTAEMEGVAKQIRGLGQDAIPVKADVSCKKDVQALVDSALEKFKKVDILVNNAGITRQGSILEMPEEVWDSLMAINLKGVFLCTQAVARQMVKQKRGKIINIASIFGLGGCPPTAVGYATSKAGVVQLTKSSAIELGPHGINVNAIAPGTIPTDFHYIRLGPEKVPDFLEKSQKLNVLSKLGSTQDIANIALFLASEDSSYITGQIIIADGGQPSRM